MSRLFLTPSAHSDLLAIWDYIAKDNATAADRVIATIQANFHKLAEAPGIGHTRRELDPVYRVWCVYSYLIVYKPDTDPCKLFGS